MRGNPIYRLEHRSGEIAKCILGGLRSSSDVLKELRESISNGAIDRERNVTVTAELNGLPLGDVMTKVRKMPAAQNLPPGVRLVPSGDSEAFVELFLGFALAMLAGVVCVYVVLLLLFHSGSQPLVILAAVLAGVTMVILDFDRPGNGQIIVQPFSLNSVIEKMRVDLGAMQPD